MGASCGYRSGDDSYRRLYFLIKRSKQWGMANTVKNMLDKFINFEMKFLFFTSDKINILMVSVFSAFLMYLAYHLPDKEWLVFVTGILIIWERVLLLKIKKMQSSLPPVDSGD